MTIIGHGIDLVEVERIARMLREHDERFRDRCFTAAEQAYCERKDKRRAECYAARFATKEAVLKAIGTGWRGGIAWTDIEIRRDELGRPDVVLTGRTREIAQAVGITEWRVSISHTEMHAVASVIGAGGV